jgi:hypothetical protein
MSPVKREDNFDKFQRFLEDASAEGLAAAGDAGLESIRAETPVESGNMRDANMFVVKDKSVFFINEARKVMGGKAGAPYNVFIHMGTRFIHADPFITRGIRKGTDAIGEALAAHHKV